MILIVWFVRIAGLVVLGAGIPALAQIEIVPGSAIRGEDVFERKGCSGCHGIDGSGGSGAPDLSSPSESPRTPELLAAAIWNHAPTMWEALSRSGEAIPGLSSGEAADLYSYFYSRLFFSPSGNARRGLEVFRIKGCAGCHTVRPGLPGSLPISNWSRSTDPIRLAGRMWNHADRMVDALKDSAAPWPRLDERDSADLLAYAESRQPGPARIAAFRPGEPEIGQALFAARCEACHSFGPSLPGRIDLLEASAPATMAGYAAEMWNHAPRMIAEQTPSSSSAEQTPSSSRWLRVEEDETPDLVAYLFAQRYFSSPGDAGKGQRVYRSKGCAGCHESESGPSAGPELTQSPERWSPITMTRALWNHGPEMIRMLEAVGQAWPRFTDGEMADLIAYLNSRLVARQAGGGLR